METVYTAPHGNADVVTDDGAFRVARLVHYALESTARVGCRQGGRMGRFQKAVRRPRVTQSPPKRGLAAGIDSWQVGVVEWGYGRRPHDDPKEGPKW